MDIDFAPVVDRISVGLLLKNRAGQLVWVNQAYADLVGKSRAELLGRSDFEFCDERTARAYNDEDRWLLGGGGPIRCCHIRRLGENDRQCFEVYKDRWVDADGETLGIQVQLLDVTPYQQSDSALRQQKDFMRILLDNIPDSVYFKDEQSRFILASRSMADRFRVGDYENLIGKTDADVFTDAHAQQARRDELRIMETGQPIINKIERETWPDRPDTWCSTTKMPLRGPSGLTIGTFGITRDISALKEAQDALRAATETANAANAAKSQFLANMSHELRTPLNGVLGISELLARSKLDDPQREHLRLIQQSAENLLKIVNDLLDLSKIEAGKMRVERLPSSFRDVIDMILGPLRISAEAKGLLFDVDIDQAIPERLEMDPGHLRSILTNLVGNAIKFTEKGKVAIKARYASGPPTEPLVSLQFSVADSGIGITAEQQRRIFHAFEQADDSTTRRFGGTGLGLAITTKLVGLMGGRIWIESAVGRGTTFHFTLQFPVAESDDVSSDVETPEQLPAAATDTSADADSQHRPLRVLLAEDGMINQKVALGFLNEMGHEVHLVTDGAAAIDAWQHGHFDCILMDVHMPQIDGLMAARQIRQIESGRTTRTPIIALTASAMPQDRRACEAAGMDGFVEKPVEFETLKQALRSVADAGYPAARVARPATKAMSAIIDLDTAIKRLRCTPERFGELLDVFRRELVMRVEQIDQGLQSGDVRTVVRAAHTLKSSAAVFAAGDLIRVASQLEEAARGGDTLSATEHLGRLRRSAEEVSHYLESTG